MRKLKVTAVSLTILVALLLSFRLGQHNKLKPKFIKYYWELSMKKLKGKNISYEFSDFELPRINLIYSHEVDEKLNKKLEEVNLENKGWMSSEFNPAEYHKAKININGKKIKCKIRLKGNTANNDMKNRSYRISVKNNEECNWKKFNLQPTKIKEYEEEWLYHEIAKTMNLFTLDYQFVQLTEKKKDKLYVLEEVFSQSLVKKYNINGIFTCYSEAAETLNRAHNQISSPKLTDLSWYISTIKPYSKSTVLKDSLLNGYYFKARALLENFRRNQINADQAFDVKILAKCFALSDLFGNNHPLSYRNLKFFYNAESGLLEGIPYDLKAGIYDLTTMSEENYHKGIIAETSSTNIFTNTLLKDSTFSSHYYKALSNIASLDLDSLQELKEALVNIEKVLLIEGIVHHIPKNKWRILKRNQEYIKIKLNPDKLFRCSYINQPKTEKPYFELTNIHDLPIDIIGLYKNNTLIKAINTKIGASITGEINNVIRIPFTIEQDDLKSYTIRGLIQGQTLNSEAVIPY